MLLEHKESKKRIMSLGFFESAAWGFEVKELSSGVWEYCPEEISLDEARSRVHEIVIQSLSGPGDDEGDNNEAYCAIPSSPCLGVNNLLRRIKHPVRCLPVCCF